MPATRLLDTPADAAAVLRRGGLVVLPTETVYGLAADATDAEAVARVFEAKGRPSDNPLIVHLATVDAVARVALVTPLGARLLDVFAPGPLTLVLPSRGTLPPAVTTGLDTVAVRIPALDLTRDVIRRTGVPLVAPSANRSGRPSPTTWAAALADLEGRVDAVLRGEPARVGLESSVVDATGDTAVLLRPGGVSLEALQEVDPGARALAAGAAGGDRSPGLRHRHYAPRARVRLLTTLAEAAPGPDALFVGLEAPPPGYGHVEVPPDIETYAHRLFALFREADAAGFARIDALGVAEAGLGRALMDRLRRAAEA